MNSKTMNAKSNSTKGVICIALAGIEFGAFPIMASLYMQFGGSSASFNFYGFLLTCVILAGIIIVQKKSFLMPKRLFLFVLLCGFFNGITRLLLTESYKYLNAGVATTLHFLYPIIAAVAGSYIFKERMPAYKWMIFLIACLSVAFFITADGNGAGVKGILLAVLSSFGFASYMVTSERAGVADADPFVVLFWVSIVSMIGVFFYGLGAGDLFQPIPVKAWIVVIVCALLNNVIAFILQLIGVRHLGATMAALFSLFEPVFSCIFGALFLGQSMTALSYIGIVMILGCLVVMILLDNKYAKAAR